MKAESPKDMCCLAYYHAVLLKFESGRSIVSGMAREAILALPLHELDNQPKHKIVCHLAFFCAELRMSLAS